LKIAKQDTPFRSLFFFFFPFFSLFFFFFFFPSFSLFSSVACPALLHCGRAASAAAAFSMSTSKLQADGDKVEME